eukprot:TRINITY_DN9428_c0_g1_i1.p1 TRINITY_DN9428_c0_g1~~TRINITY_DN9428_c0_g1_i1.p1  ORF type:complete len:477 (+),score=144.58 TRINITY_DN9428_c0_g1_i1:138-1568(+)
MPLSDRERKELHDHIGEYLRVNGFASTAEIFEAECKEVVVQQPPPNSALERKYNSLLRLSKQLDDERKENKALRQQMEEMADPTQAARLNRSKDLMPASQPMYTLKGHTADVTAMAFHPTQPLLCSVADDGRGKVWDYDTGESDRTLSGHTGGVKCVAFSHDGVHVATGCDDTHIRIFSWEKAAQLRALFGHEHTVSWVEFVPPESTQLVSASRDHTCKVWDWQAGHCVRTVRHHREWVRFARVNRSGRSCVSADDTGQLMLWNTGDDHGRPPRIVGAHGAGGASPVPESAVFANHAAEEVLRGLVEKQSGAGGSVHADPRRSPAPAVGRTPSPLSEPGSAASPLDDQLAAARERKRRAQEEKQVQQDPLADSRFIASSGRDKEIQIFDLSNCSRVALLSGHDDWVHTLAFHVNGKALFSCSDDGDVRVWNLLDGRCTRKLKQCHDGAFVHSLAYHPAGRFLATCGEKQIKVWPCK